MPDEIHLEWSFEPADLFEERAELQIGGCTFVIDAGTVICRAPFEGDPAPAGVLWGFCNALHQRVNAVLLAAQTLEHKAYTLSGAKNTVRLSPDGGRHFFVLAEGLRLKTSLSSLDVQQADGAGNVILNTRRDRIGKRIALAQSAGEHITDPAANSILRSYAAAVRDPGNELIHLYEIRDALADRLGGEHEACTALGISNTKWRRLGTLASVEPLQEGRHRGQHLGVLRAATPEELTEARSIARMMIEAYLRYLTRANTSGNSWA